MSDASERKEITASQTVAGLRRSITQSQTISIVDEDEINYVVNINERNQSDVVQNNTTGFCTSADKATIDLYCSLTETRTNTEDYERQYLLDT